MHASTQTSVWDWHSGINSSVVAWSQAASQSLCLTDNLLSQPYKGCRGVPCPTTKGSTEIQAKPKYKYCSTQNVLLSKAMIPTQQVHRSSDRYRETPLLDRSENQRPTRRARQDEQLLTSRNKSEEALLPTVELAPYFLRDHRGCPPYLQRQLLGMDGRRIGRLASRLSEQGSFEKPQFEEQITWCWTSCQEVGGWFNPEHDTHCFLF